MNQTNDVKIRDLGLAATLVTSGFSIASIDRSNPSRVVFIFDENPELQTQIDKFWAGQLSLPAHQLLNNMRTLKARIYNDE